MSTSYNQNYPTEWHEPIVSNKRILEPGEIIPTNKRAKNPKTKVPENVIIAKINTISKSAVTNSNTGPISSNAIAALAVSQSIGFNNDGFSSSDDDSNDDHEVMGLLGEQLPMIALQRLTQNRNNN